MGAIVLALLEFFFADASRSLRLRGQCPTALSPRRREGRKENAKEISFVAARLLFLNFWNSRLFFFSHGFTRIQFFMASDPIRQRQQRDASGPFAPVVPYSPHW